MADWADQYLATLPNTSQNTGSSSTQPDWADQFLSSQQQSSAPVQPSGPISIEQAAQNSVGTNSNNTGSRLAPVTNFLSNAGRDLVGTLGNVAKVAGYGVIGAGEKALNLIPGVDINNKATQVASSIPGAIAQIPGQVAGDVKEIVTNPHQAIHDVGEFSYQHPIQALLNASGIGSAVGAGADIIGGVADKAALNSAAIASGLSPEEAASAVGNAVGTGTLEQGTLSKAGNVATNVSNAINPLNAAMQLTKPGAAVVKKVLSIITGSGSDAYKAIGNVAANNDLAPIAMSGARGQSSDIAQNSFQDAIKSIDNSNSGNANLFGEQQLAPIRNQISDTLKNSGVNLRVLSPDELKVAQEWLDQYNGTTSTGSANLNGASNPGYAQNYIDAANHANDVFGKYFGKTQAGDADQLRAILYGNKWKSGAEGATQDQVAQTLQTVVNNNGLVGVAPGITKLPANEVKNIMNEVITPLFRLNGGDPAFEANATNLDLLKSKLQNMYKQGTFFQPLSGEDKLTNKVTTGASHVIGDQLSQNPDYAQAMQNYQAFHQGQSMQPLIPTSPQKIMSGQVGSPLTDTALAYALAHALGPIGLGGLIAASPRAVIEGANIYGKVMTPVRAIANNPALSSILNGVGNIIK